MYSPIIINKKSEEKKSFYSKKKKKKRGFYSKNYLQVSLLWSWVIPPNNQVFDLVVLSDIHD